MHRFKHIAANGLVALATLAAVSNVMADPALNVNPQQNPNLAGAQQLINQAYNLLRNSQIANQNDMNGHAELAKNLLDQASYEIKQAALIANWKR